MAADVESILDDTAVVAKWEEFETTCTDDLHQYFAMDLELKKRLQHAEESLREEVDHDEVEQLQWQVAAGIRVPNQREAESASPVVDQEFQWIGNHRTTYTADQLLTAPDWIPNNPAVVDREQQLQDLPVVTYQQLNEKQALWYNMVMDSIHSQTKLLLIVTGTAGTGKSHTICAISHAFSARQVHRCATTASAAYLI